MANQRDGGALRNGKEIEIDTYCAARCPRPMEGKLGQAAPAGRDVHAVLALERLVENYRRLLLSVA